MRGLGTAVWAVVLGGSVAAIGAGFAGGRAIGDAATPLMSTAGASAGLPANTAVVERDDRALRGIHSFDASDGADPDLLDDPDRSVAGRLAPAAHDGDPRVALVVVDASRAGDALGALRSAPFPLAFVVNPRDDGAVDVARTLRAAGRSVFVAASRAGDAAAVARLGADGVFGSVELGAARRLTHALPPDAMVIDDATDAGTLFAAARAAHRAVGARDVVVDARDGERYADFLFGSALAIARRQGTVVIALHARPATVRALGRFADRAARDGVAIVDVARVVTRS